MTGELIFIFQGSCYSHVRPSPEWKPFFDCCRLRLRYRIAGKVRQVVAAEAEITSWGHRRHRPREVSAGSRKTAKGVPLDERIDAVSRQKRARKKLKLK